MTGADTQACLTILIHLHVHTADDNAERCALMVFFTHHDHCMQDCGSTKNKQQSCQPMTFCLLSTQQIQALLTLFSKFFSFSLKVLVCYRSQAHVYLYMKLTTHFALHSQKAWFWRCTQCTRSTWWQTGISPLLLLCSKRRASRPPLAMHFNITCRGRVPRLLKWVMSCSFAITTDIPFGLISSAYLYA